MSLILLGAALAGLVQTPEPLTLDAATAIAVKNAFSVRLAASDVERARQDRLAANGGLYPRLVLGGSYVRLAQGVNTSATSGGGFSSFKADVKQLNLVLTQLIDVSGVARKSVQATRYQEQANQQSYDSSVNDIKNDVRAQFYSVLAAKALVGVQQEQLKNAQQRVKNIEIRYQSGDVSRFDQLRLQNDEKKSEQTLVDAEGNYTLSKQALNNLLGRPIETDFDPVDSEQPGDLGASPDAAVEAAMSNRPEVKQGEFQALAATRQRQATEGGTLPSLTFSAQYNRTIDPFPGQTASSAIGPLTLSYPLYDSGVTRARVNSARQVEEQARILLEQIKLAVSLDVRNALTQVQTTHKALEVALSSQDLAKEALRLAQLRYDEGAGILLDVTTAQAEYTLAEGAVVTAKYQYLTAIAALKRAIGTDDLSGLTETKK